MQHSHWPQSIKAILILSALVIVLFVLPYLWLISPDESLAKELRRLPDAISWDIHSDADTLGFGPPTIHFWTRSSDESVAQSLVAEFERLLWKRSEESITNPLPHEQRWTRNGAAVELYEGASLEAPRGLACGDTVIAFYPGEASCWAIRFHASD